MARASLICWLGLGAVTGALLAPPLARAQQSCMGDGDCAEGFECDLPPAIGADCDSSAGNCSAADPAPRVGQCEPAQLRCQATSDCPMGLSCDLHDGGDCTSTAPASAGAGGSNGDDTPADQAPCEDQPSEGECVFTLTDCTKDSQCSDDEVCSALGSTSDCSGSAPACSPGGECPEAPDEVCTETRHSYCFPPRMDCDDAGKCPSGTRCIELPEDSLDNPPPGWEGATALCLPETWALVLEGRVQVEGGSSSSDSAAETSASRDAAKGEQSGASAAGTGDGDDVMEDDGCAVRTPGMRSPRGSLSLLGLAVIGLVWRRRRAARR